MSWRPGLSSHLILSMLNVWPSREVTVRALWAVASVRHGGGTWSRKPALSPELRSHQESADKDSSLRVKELSFRVALCSIPVLCVVTQLCLTLCDPMNCSPPGSSVHGDFSRQEYWSGLPCPLPGDLPDPGLEPRSPTLQADSLPPEPPGFHSHFITSGKIALWKDIQYF